MSLNWVSLYSYFFNEEYVWFVKECDDCSFWCPGATYYWGWASPYPLAYSHWASAATLTISVPLCELAQGPQCLSCTETQKWVRYLGVVPTSAKYNGDNFFHHFTCYALINTTQDGAVVALWCQDSLLSHTQLATTRIHRSFSAELPPQQANPHLRWCNGLVCPRCRTWHLLLLTSLLSVPSFSPSRCLRLSKYTPHVEKQ